LVRLGIPIDLARREALQARLSKFLKRKVTNLSSAIRLLEVRLIVSITKAPAISTSSLNASAVPTKYRTETRSRRVTARLAAGSYVANVTVRLRDSRGRTFVTGSTTGQTRFTVR
jgi:hypothetical protein